MGKAGKRKEMVEDRCVQEMRVDVRCVKEVRVKVLLVKEVCVKAWCKNVLCANVLYVQVLWISGGWSCNVAITDVPTPWVEVNGNRGSWQHVQGSPQTVMRADGLQQVLGGCKRLPLRTARQENCRSQRHLAGQASQASTTRIENPTVQWFMTGWTAVRHMWCSADMCSAWWNSLQARQSNPLPRSDGSTCATKTERYLAAKRHDERQGETNRGQKVQQVTVEK